MMVVIAVVAVELREGGRQWMSSSVSPSFSENVECTNMYTNHLYMYIIAQML